MLFFIRNIGCFIFLYALCCFCKAIPARGMQDSLAEYSYLELEDLIDESENDSTRMSTYLSYYLQKARKEKNIGRIAIYYRAFVFYRKKEDRLALIDSALHYALQTKDKALIGSVYLTQGAVFLNLRNYQQVLNSYLKADEYISKTNDEYSIQRIKNHIASLKNYMGYYDQAEDLFKECITYFGQDESSYNMHRGYISSLQGLAWSYSKTNRLLESNELLAKALNAAKKADFSDLDVHYTLFKIGINDYLLGKYDSAVHRIEQELPFLHKNEDFAWASIGEYYIGMSYWNKGEREKAIAYFEKIDEVFESKNYTHPDLRSGYELLINHYKEQGDKDNQIKYISQLVRVDSVFNQTHKHLLNRIHKEYTTKELVQAKAKLETTLYLQKHKTALIIGGGTLALLTLSVLLYLLHRKNQKEKEVARTLIQTLQEKPVAAVVMPAEKTVASRKASAQIKEEVVGQLMEKLDHFEQKQKFLKPGITLENLANTFGTNTAYLSRVINNYKNQTFSDYLNQLRIDYMVNDIVGNKDSVFFKYSIESIAKQVGFKTANAFSRAFYVRMKVKPSVFIEELRANNKSIGIVA